MSLNEPGTGMVLLIIVFQFLLTNFTLIICEKNPHFLQKLRKKICKPMMDNSYLDKVRINLYVHLTHKLF